MIAGWLARNCAPSESSAPLTCAMLRSGVLAHELLKLILLHAETSHGLERLVVIIRQRARERLHERTTSVGFIASFTEGDYDPKARERSFESKKVWPSSERRSVTS